MHIFSNLKVVGSIIVLAAIGFFILISNKPSKAIVVETPPAIVEEASSSNFLEEAEKRREQMQEEKSELERQAKLLKQKENSVECQFWKQQKTDTSDAKIDEKIIEFCTFSSVAHSSATDSSTTSDAGATGDTSSAAELSPLPAPESSPPQ